MIFEVTRTFAIDKLNLFIEQNLAEYSKLRNFDYGPNNRSNISCLSPYISHGIVTELEVIKKILNKFSFQKNEKFIEIIWEYFSKKYNNTFQTCIKPQKTIKYSENTIKHIKIA